MAAGLVTIPVVDIEGGGVIRNMQYWSSDGTVNGGLSLAISTGGSGGPGLTGVKGADGVTISGPTNGVSVLGTKLNDGSQSSVGGTHLTMGGVDPATSVYRPLQIDSAGRQIIKPATSATSTPANVASVTAAAILLAANANRLPGSMITNDSTAILYILIGAVGAVGNVSATNYTVAIDGKTTVPGVFFVPDGWLGVVQGIWVSANGFARVTELSA